LLYQIGPWAVNASCSECRGSSRSEKREAIPDASHPESFCTSIMMRPHDHAHAAAWKEDPPTRIWRAACLSLGG
jgi:hypothetical protein